MSQCMVLFGYLVVVSPMRWDLSSRTWGQKAYRFEQFMSLSRIRAFSPLVPNFFNHKREQAPACDDNSISWIFETKGAVAVDDVRCEVSATRIPQRCPNQEQHVDTSKNKAVFDGLHCPTLKFSCGRPARLSLRLRCPKTSFAQCATVNGFPRLVSSRHMYC